MNHPPAVEQLNQSVVVASMNTVTSTCSFSFDIDADIMEAWPLLAQRSPSRPKSIYRFLNETTTSTANVNENATQCNKPNQIYDSCEKKIFRNYCASFDELQKIVEEDPNWIHLQDFNGFLPVHYALAPGMADIETIQYLVENYPESLMVATTFGNTPLHQACCYHSTSLEILQYLVQKCPKAFTMLNKLDETPLDIARMISSNRCPGINNKDRYNKNTTTVLNNDCKLEWLEEQMEIRTTASNMIYKDLLTQSDLWICTTATPSRFVKKS